MVDIPSYQEFREILNELRGVSISLEEDKTTAAGVSQKPDSPNMLQVQRSCTTRKAKTTISKSPKITRVLKICWEFIINQIEPYLKELTPENLDFNLSRNIVDYTRDVILCAIYDST